MTGHLEEDFEDEFERGALCNRDMLPYLRIFIYFNNYTDSKKVEVYERKRGQAKLLKNSFLKKYIAYAKSRRNPALSEKACQFVVAKVAVQILL